MKKWLSRKRNLLNPSHRDIAELPADVEAPRGDEQALAEVLLAVAVAALPVEKFDDWEKLGIGSK